MKHTYSFGKIDATGDGRKSNLVEISVELRENKHGDKVFSASGSVWNAFHSDIVMGGQCLDSLMEYPVLRHNKAFQQIHEMWTKHHLNDMHAGTPAQEAALDKAVEEGILPSRSAHLYDAQCEYLKSIDLYEDKNYLVEKNGEMVPYRYGTGWLTVQIPEEDLTVIQNMVEGKLKASPDKGMDR